MKTEHVENGIKWINLSSPSAFESRSLVEDYEINPVIADELLSPSVRTKLDFDTDENNLYLILHFPSIEKGERVSEIDFVLGKKILITAHYSPISDIDEFEKRLEVQNILNHKNNEKDSDKVVNMFTTLLKIFYENMLHKIEVIRDSVDEAEKRMFSGEEREVVKEISKLNRILLTYKEVLLSHESVLEMLSISGTSLYGKNFEKHMVPVLVEYERVLHDVRNAKEYLDDLKQINDSLVSTKQNEVMKTLTVMAFLVLPLSLIASIFGMNAANMPLIGSENDFLTILSLMLCVTVVMFIYFKIKKWL